MSKPHKHAAVIKAWADGAKIQYRDGGGWDDLSDDNICWDVECEYRVKPVKVYPVTQMARSALFETYAAICYSMGYKTVSAESNGLAAVANAALRHAIDAGQVVTAEDASASTAELADLRRRMVAQVEEMNGKREARDMAVAEAVKRCCSGITGGSYMAISNMNLAAVISKVPS